MSQPAPPQSLRVLVVDDEKNIRRTLKMILEAEGYKVSTAASAEQALEHIEADQPECVVMDVRLPNMDGVTALAKIREQWNADVVPIIMISGHASVSDAVRATQLGAFDFFEKPLDRNRILVSIRNAVQHVQMAHQVKKLRSSLDERFKLVGQGPLMLELFQTIEKVAPTRGRVLITGESGTGKELVARAIHRNSRLSDRPFIKVNCAAISPELIESELFGHERGAFTGAVARRKGLFEVADGGTIFLDEVGDMSLSAQAKVLRVLQTGEFVPVGGEQVVRVDVRVLAATNKNLEEGIQSNQFREDLYFRLNVIPIRTPALREHRTDIPILVSRFVDEFCRENGFRTKTVDPKALDTLVVYPWPGNVRELKNVIERVVILSNETIMADDLPAFLAEPSVARVNLDSYADRTLREFREEMERAFVLLKLNEFEWNISRTATALGVERTNLHKKIKALGLKRDQH